MCKKHPDLFPMPISDILNGIAEEYNPGTADTAILDRASNGELKATGLGTLAQKPYDAAKVGKPISDQNS